ncbi:PAS domain-containing sensor histidine kinase [Tardiphaga sp. 1201_B9_N1_1]|uniref:PAS domain-containing sensor histidine kinase n=1 Tax=unclassified Tardiphaga TaxID=2631404 RepID=UPI003F23438D
MNKAVQSVGKPMRCSGAVANSNHRSVLDYVADCYVGVDADLRITDMNAVTERWIGNRLEAVVGLNAFDVFRKITDDDREAILTSIETKSHLKVEITSTVHPDRWIEVDFWPSESGTSILFRDITERKAAELASEKAKNLLHMALDSMSSEIAILDQNGLVLVANEAWLRFLRDAGTYYTDGGIGELYLGIRTLHPVRTHMSGYSAGIKSVLAGEIREFKLRFRTKVGQEHRNYRLRASRIDSDGWRRVVVVRDDVTELETALHDVDNMAVRMVNLQETERQRYAAELHDSTVQHLTAASLNLMVLRSRTASQDNEDVVGLVEASVAEAQREIRSVSYLLYPRSLDEDGLNSTLHRFADGFSARTGIETFVRMSGPLNDLPLPLQRAALRIVQEAMTNTHRHASASTVRIRVAVGGGRLTVAVADDGRGLPMKDDLSVINPGVGISGMKARVHQFGGFFRIRSTGRGTIVFCRIPLPYPRDAGGVRKVAGSVRRGLGMAIANIGLSPILFRVFADFA